MRRSPTPAVPERRALYLSACMRRNSRVIALIWARYVATSGGRAAQGWFEVANAQPGQGALHSVDDARALPDQAVTSLRNQCTSNKVGHFSFHRFSHVSGMSVPPKEDMQCR